MEGWRAERISPVTPAVMGDYEDPRGPNFAKLECPVITEPSDASE